MQIASTMLIALLGVLIAAIFDPSLSMMLTIAAWCLAVIAGTIVAVTVHELGHAVVGVRLGLSLEAVATSPVVVERSNDRWRLKVTRSLPGVHGFARFDLTAVDWETFPRQWRRMAMAGPVANVCLTLVSFAAAWRLSDALTSFSWWLWFLGGYSLFGAVVNSLPRRRRPVPLDGFYVSVLGAGGDRAASFVREIRLARVFATATRPSAWDEATVAEAEATFSQLDTYDDALLDEWLLAAYLLYMRYQDHGQTDAAGAVLARVAAVPRTRANSRHGRFDAADTLTAIHLALWNNDGARAKAILARVSIWSILRQNTLWLGAEAAITLAEGNAEGALKKARQARKRLALSAERIGADRTELDWWDELIARAGASLVATARSSAPGPIAHAVLNDPRFDVLLADPPIERKPKPQPTRSVVVSLARMIGTTTMLSLAFLALVVVGLTFWTFARSMEEVSDGLLVFAWCGSYIGAALASARWIVKRAGWGWGAPCALFWLPVLAIYLYRQYRGTLITDQGDRPLPFPSVRLFGCMVALSVLLFVSGVGVAIVNEINRMAYEAELSATN